MIFQKTGATNMLEATKRLTKEANEAKVMLRTIYDYAWIIIRVGAVSLLGGTTWSVSQYFQHQMSVHDAEVVQIVLITGFFFFHTTMAATVMAGVLKRYNLVRLALINKDRQAFEAQRAIILPGFIKFLLATFSTVIVYWFSRIHFESWQTGFMTATTLTLMLSLYWVVLTELDDPVDSPWFHHQAPSDWLCDDVPPTAPVINETVIAEKGSTVNMNNP
jgi:hypothetical protein